MKIKFKEFFLYFSSITINFVQFGYFLSKYLYFGFFFYGIRKEIKRTDLLFSSYLFNWRKYTHLNGKSYNDDNMIGEVIERSKNRFDIICIDNPTYFRSIRETYDKFRESDDWICVEQFMDISIILKAFHLTLKSLSGCKIDKDLENYFISLNMSVNFRSLLFLMISRKIISSIRPEVIFLTCEYCPLHRELTYAAHLNNSTVIALQHGIITPSHREYIFSDSRLAAILPDIICVYGQYHYDLLTERSIFKPQQIAVTGQPRYDVFYFSDKVYDKKTILDKYNINRDHNIILLATQWGVEIKEKNRDLKAIFEMMKGLENTTLVIKQHPLENKKDTNIIKGYLDMYKVNSIIVPKNSDTNELLFVCDLMITKNSTIAMEALALNKPIIVLNLSGEPDIVDYVEQGIALGVYDEKYLRSAVEKLLKGDISLAENRQKFIDKYLYKIDGLASERVVNLIEKMIKGKHRAAERR